MADHALVIVNVGAADHAALSRECMLRYCRTWDIDFVELREPRINLSGTDPDYNYRTLEKCQAFECLDTYQRILRIDTDVLISPKAPNVFDVVPEDAVGVVYEDVGDKAAARRGEMEAVAAAYGTMSWPIDRRYFNSGVMVFSRVHRDAFRITEDDQRLIASGALGSFKEQNWCNWRVYEGGCPLFELDHRFNHLRFFSDRAYGGHDRFDSYFLHYAGSQRRKARRMTRDRAVLLKAWETGTLRKPTFWHRLLRVGRFPK